MKRVKLEWIIKNNTALLTYDSHFQFLLLLPSDFPTQSPFLAMHPSMISNLHCPTDLEFSSNVQGLLSRAAQFPEILKRGYKPIELENTVSSPWSEIQSLDNLLDALSQFFEKYATPAPSVAFRFPRFSGWSNPVKLALLVFLIKVTILSFSKRQYTGDIPFNYCQDFQFHRKWQEMTMNIPYEYWYPQTELNPHWYFDLDYPPLAGMFHMILGKYVTQPLVQNAVRLSTVHRVSGDPLPGYPGQLQIDHYAQQERINENGIKVYPLQASHYHKSHKYFFVNRVSFAVMDLLTMAPASFILVQYLWRRVNPRLRSIMFLLLNSIPMAVYFDISDTQINFLSMSFYLLAYTCIISQHFALSACLAVLSVLSKQTALTLFLPYLIFVLSKLRMRFNSGNASQRKSTVLYFFLIGVSPLCTLMLFLYPFLTPRSLYYLRWQLFPFHITIIAQPLPTFWYFVNMIYQFPQNPTLSWHYAWMPRICSSIILSLCLPSLIKLFRSPTRSNLNLAILQSVLLFYLFGYRVHEKSIVWYIFALLLTTFQFPYELLSFVNLITLLILRPMVIEYGKEFVGVLYFLLYLASHYVLTTLPQYPATLYSQNFPQKCDTLISKIAGLPSLLKYVIPAFQLYVGYCTLLYITNPEEVFLELVLVMEKYMFVGLLWLVAYHYVMMFGTRRDITEPYFFGFHQKKN